MKYKDHNCPWRLFVTPNIMGVWEIRINPFEYSYYKNITRADHKQMTSKMIDGIIKNWLKDNLKISIKEAMS
jgi:hypothetical protein